MRPTIQEELLKKELEPLLDIAMKRLWEDLEQLLGKRSHEELRYLAEHIDVMIAESMARTSPERKDK